MSRSVFSPSLLQSGRQLQAAAATSSGIVARAEGLRSGWASPGTVASVFGATFLILLVWATLGAMVTAITRRAASGIAVAFLLATLEASGPGVAELPGLPGAAALSLSRTFMPDGVPHLGLAAGATVLLSAYGATFVAITIAVLKHRDVSDH